MDGFVERVFPIRIQIDPERERLRRNQTIGTSAVSFSYKRLERHRCHDDAFDASQALIQAFGALLALQPTADGQYCVHASSDNTLQLIGYSPEALFAQNDFCELVVESHKLDFCRRLQSLFNNLEVDRSATDVFHVSLMTMDRQSREFWCTAHIPKEPKDIIICELEPLHSILSPSLAARTQSQTPTRMLNYQATKQEWETSTKRKSKPLHALRGRPDFSSGTSADLIGTMNEIQSQLISSSSIEALFGTIVGTVSQLTSFDRVMVYRFDECKCGAVVAEYVNPLVSEDLFIGLHFPSSDLPPRTRHLYKADRVQILRHRTSDKASLIYQSPDTVTALDLTRSYLRDVSPDQVKFFSDINVSSAMTISLVVEDDLWGLITCHSYGPTIVEVSPPLREACRNIGQCASSQVERLLFAERLEARILLATGLSRKSPAAFITSSSSSLLQIFAATFGMLVMNDQVRAVGRLESYQEALVLVKYFRTRGVTSVIASQKINADFPDLLYPPGFTLIAGLLVVPLSHSGSDFLVVFRKEQLMEIHWAGNTEERFELIGGGNAEPNASFHRWVEHVTDTSREWTAWQLEMATILTTLYGTFTELWKKRQANIEKSRMRQLLISNASHEVRTPLNHIINNLEVALDGNMDKGVEEHVKASLTASKSLIYVINDLLDITKSEESDSRMHEEPFSLQGLMLEVLGVFAMEAERKGLKLSFSSDTAHLPGMIIGDPQRLRQAISNILSNSVEYSDYGNIDIKVQSLKITNNTLSEFSFDITIRDEGEGMSEEHLDMLFHQFENILDEDDKSSAKNNDSATSSHQIGLGLAIVARFVCNSSGQMKIQTKKGVGTQVSLRLPMRTASAELSIKTPLLTPPTDMEATGIVWGRTTLETSGLGSPPENRSASAYLPDAYPFPSSNTSTLPIEKIKLRILVAEDNPLNAKILKLQLIKMGHEVVVVSEGQACFDRFRQDHRSFDVILMDFQMPLIDGPTSTKLIRDFEMTASPLLSPRAMSHGRIPIFAVSASLEEDKRGEYARGGFDGWILKPINFRHLNTIMSGTWDDATRTACVYKPGMWESGGWLEATW